MDFLCLFYFETTVERKYWGGERGAGSTKDMLRGGIQNRVAVSAVALSLDALTTRL